MVTIVLLVSRIDFLERVISKIELLECKNQDTNILAVVDGDDALYVKTRNLIQGTKFNQRLTVRSDYPGNGSRYNIKERRQRIAFAHNQARQLIQHDEGYVFSVEDDTLIGVKSLQKLMNIAINNRAFGMAEGVELGRWGVPYVGAWKADDIYETKQLTSLENKYTSPEDELVENIDAGGLFCSLIRADLYRQHEFTADNGLGPDVNLGLELRRLGYYNFIAWHVPCTHLNMKMGKEEKIKPSQETKIVKITLDNRKKWHVTY